MKDNVELIVKAVCTIIDHFFDRREQHIDVALTKVNTNIAAKFNAVLENGPAFIEKVETMIDSTMSKKETVTPTQGESSEDLPN